VDATTIRRLEELFAEWPILVAGPVEASEVDSIASELGVPLPADYRWFVTRYGGAMVGSGPVFGRRCAEVMGVERFDVVAVTQHFRRDGWPTVDEAIVVSEDGFGNPVCMSSEGRLWVHDHDVGAVTSEWDSFETFVLSLLDERAGDRWP